MFSVNFSLCIYINVISLRLLQNIFFKFGYKIKFYYKYHERKARWYFKCWDKKIDIHIYDF